MSQTPAHLRSWAEQSAYERAQRIDPSGRAQAVSERDAKGATGDFAGILCAGCQHGTVYSRRDANRPEAYCRMIGREVPTTIQACSSFHSITPRMSLEEMSAIALLVDTREGPPGGGGYV